jgi:inorganic pyrophosphatase
MVTTGQDELVGSGALPHRDPRRGQRRPRRQTDVGNDEIDHGWTAVAITTSVACLPTFTKGAPMHIDAISVGKKPPDDVNVIVEVPVDGRSIKYEMDMEAGALVVNRFLSTSMTYPGNYGFVPHTLSQDGDPIDVLIANTWPLVAGCVINVRPIGVLVMEDDGDKDEKIIAVPVAKLTRCYDKVENYTDLPEIFVKQIEHFFSHYKDLELGKWVKIASWQDVNVAKKMISDAVGRYNSQKIANRESQI